MFSEPNDAQIFDSALARVALSANVSDEEAQALLARGAPAANQAVLGVADHFGVDVADARAGVQREMVRRLQAWVNDWSASRAATVPPATSAADDPVFGPMLRSYDRGDLDRVHQLARATARRHGIDELDAIEKIQQAHAGLLARADGQPVTFSAVADALGVTGGDLVTLERAAAETATRLEASAETPRPAGDVDALDRVLLSAGTDRAELLTDPAAPMRAWLAARDLGSSEPFDDFKERWAVDVEHGVDTVATLQLKRHDGEVRLLHEQAAEREETLETLRREDAVRQLEHEAEKAAASADAARARLLDANQS